MSVKLQREPIKDDGWRPRKYGGKFYCSPLCGADCTQAAFAKATADAAALAARMGNGFEPCVWENMGWYWLIMRGVGSDVDGVAAPLFTLREKYRGRGDAIRYTAAFHGTACLHADAAVPEIAYKRVVAKARAVLARLERELDDA